MFKFDANVLLIRLNRTQMFVQCYDTKDLNTKTWLELEQLIVCTVVLIKFMKFGSD